MLSKTEYYDDDDPSIFQVKRNIMLRMADSLNATQQRFQEMYVQRHNNVRQVQIFPFAPRTCHVSQLSLTLINTGRAAFSTPKGLLLFLSQLMRKIDRCLYGTLPF